jgi:hypothetical protein
MTKEIFKHYKPLHEQVRIHRQAHSGTWKIISNALGNKKDAQEQLDILQSALKLQELVKTRIEWDLEMQDKLGKEYEVQGLKELQDLVDRSTE